VAAEYVAAGAETAEPEGEPDISDGELSEPESEGGEVASESEDEERAQSDEEES
jgi:hypothetical protein